MQLLEAIVVFVLLLVLVFVGKAWLAAYLEIKSRPREPMQWCDKHHAFFRTGHCVPMSGLLVCPRCYHDAIKGAKSG